jgi:hypothetical protein
MAGAGGIGRRSGSALGSARNSLIGGRRLVHRRQDSMESVSTISSLRSTPVTGYHEETGSVYSPLSGSRRIWTRRSSATRQIQTLRRNVTSIASDASDATVTSLTINTTFHERRAMASDSPIVSELRNQALHQSQPSSGSLDILTNDNATPTQTGELEVPPLMRSHSSSQLHNIDEDETKRAQMGDSPRSADILSSPPSLDSLRQMRRSPLVSSRQLTDSPDSINQSSPVPAVSVDSTHYSTSPSVSAELERTRARLQRIRRENNASLSVSPPLQVRDLRHRNAHSDVGLGGNDPRSKHIHKGSTDSLQPHENRSRRSSVTSMRSASPLRGIRSDEDLGEYAGLWHTAMSMRHADPNIARSLDQLTRLRAEIGILDKTIANSTSDRVIGDNESDAGSIVSNETNNGVQNKMRLVLERKRKEFAEQMRVLERLCGTPRSSPTLRSSTIQV